MKPNLFLQLARPRRTWIPYGVLAIALLLTALATQYVAVTTKAKDRLRFENAVQGTRDEIHNHLQTYITLLRAGNGLFAASNQVSRQEFRAFVNRLELQRNYPGIQGIGFSVRVKSEEKAALIAQMQRQGVKDFAIRPKFERTEYHSTIYLEPLDRRNQVAIGFDMFTEAVRRTAMERARDTGAPAASGRVTLVQEIDRQKQAGFLIYVPVYRNGFTPETVAERQTALIGFVYSAFRVNDLLKGILGDEKNAYVDFQIYDGSALQAENLLHRFNRSTVNGKSYQPRFTTTTTIDVAGHTWSIVFTSRPGFERVAERNLVPYIALGGFLISLALFGVTWLQVHNRLAAERAAAELRSSEQALRESELRLRNILDSLFTFVGVLSPDGILLESNRAPLEVAALKPEDILGKPFTETFWWSYSPLVQSQIQSAIQQAAQGESSRFDVQLQIAGGNLIDTDFSLNPVFDAQGQVCYLVPSGIDITKRKQAEAEISKALAREKKVNELKSRFISMASHELRTPLATILSSTELLQHYNHKWTEEKKLTHFQRIQAAVKQMTGLLNDVLLIGKAEAGKFEFNPKPLDLAQFCRELAEEMQSTADTHQISLQIQGECTNACMDEKLLRHIFSNLLSNAIKYSPVNSSVDFELICKQEEAVFLVRDRGIGIPPADQVQLFNSFYRASNVGTISGTGLGLAIVKKSVDLHGGQISFNSEVGVGTTFIVTLPLSQQVSTVVNK